MRAALLFILLGACGYHLVDPGMGGGRSLFIPVAENPTRWRGIESSLTLSLREEAQRQLDVRLESKDGADLVLTTQVNNASRRALVAGRQGNVSVGSAALTIDWQLVDRSGAQLGEGRFQRNFEFRPDVGENSEDSLRRIARQASKAIVMEVSSRLAETD